MAETRPIRSAIARMPVAPPLTRDVPVQLRQRVGAVWENAISSPGRLAPILQRAARAGRSIRRPIDRDFPTAAKSLPEGRRPWHSRVAATAAFAGRIVLDETTVQSEETQHPWGLAADGSAEVTATASQGRAQGCRPRTMLGVAGQSCGNFERLSLLICVWLTTCTESHCAGNFLRPAAN